MKKSALLATLIFVASMTACGAQPSNTVPDTTTAIQTDAETTTPTQETEVSTEVVTEQETEADTEEETFTIHLTKGFADDIGEPDPEKVISYTREESGDAYMTVTKSQQAEMLAGYETIVKDREAAIVADGTYSSVTSIEHNADHTLYTVTSDDPDAFTKGVGIALLFTELRVYGLNYQSFASVEEPAVDIICVDQDGNELLAKHYTMLDLEK